VETGLDLNDFTTLLYYNISYNLFTLRQSSRRSWRINQCAPRIEVYFFYYENTMQHRAIRLMASKLAVAGVIEGNLTDEGLAAMSECQDMTTALARELTQGIEGEVEDLGAVFKRMALLKPVSEPLSAMPVLDVIEGEVATYEDAGISAETAVSTPESPVIKIAAQSAKGYDIDKKPTKPSGLIGLLQPLKPRKGAKEKGPDILETQMSLFDMLLTTA